MAVSGGRRVPGGIKFPTHTRAAARPRSGGTSAIGGRRSGRLPVEFFVSDPEFVHEDGEFARQCGAGFLGTGAFGEPFGPGLEGEGFFDDGDDVVGAFVEEMA